MIKEQLLPHTKYIREDLETGAKRKLSRPWHRLYHVSNSGPDVTAIKMYFPTESQIHVHMSRTCALSTGFPAGYYWYNEKMKGTRHPPKYVKDLLSDNCPDPKVLKSVENCQEDNDYNTRK